MIRFLLLSFSAAILATTAVQAQTRPAIGGMGSAPGAMIFYVAHGGKDACGFGCSDWIAAEGVVQFDTFKRLIAILDRQAGKKLPVLINAFGQSNLNVSVSMGRILRDRGVDAMVGVTEVDACKDKPEAECFTLKRPGGPLDATAKETDITCEFACVLMLAGGVHRSLPPGGHVILAGMSIHNRLAPNVSEERRENLTVQFTDQFRRYLAEMGVGKELMDIVESESAAGHRIEIPAAEWSKLHLVTPAPL